MSVSAVQNILNNDILSVIFSYLKFKDASALCQTNREAYSLINNAYQFSFVSLNLNHPQYRKFQKKFNGKIQYVNCLKSIKGIELLDYKFKNLKIISFGRTFNQPLECLPSTVEIITFHKRSLFNHQIKGKQVPNLRRVYFGRSYNQRIDFMSDKVEIIYFFAGSVFNQPIRKYPKALKEIYFGQYFNQNLDDLFQQTQIKILHFTDKSHYNLQLSIGLYLTHLYLGNEYRQPLNLLYTQLKYLRFSNGSIFNNDLYLPSTLQNLYLGAKYNQPLQLSNNLISVKFYIKSLFNQDIIITEKLQEITFGRHFRSNIIQIGKSKALINMKFANRSKFTNIELILNFIKINPDIQIIHPQIQNKDINSQFMSDCYLENNLAQIDHNIPYIDSEYIE